jgi:hypothetical protein
MAAKKHKYWETRVTLETGEPEPVEEYPEEKRVVSGSWWMGGLFVALFFLPAVNGLIAGIVGGIRVGSPRDAIMTSLGPAAIGSALLWMILAVVPVPYWGPWLSPIGISITVTFSVLGLLLGAAIGGVIAQHNREAKLHRM